MSEYQPLGLGQDPNLLVPEESVLDLTPYQPPSNGIDLNLGLPPMSTPFTGTSNPVPEPSLGNQDYVPIFDEYRPPTSSGSNYSSSDFQGFDKTQMRTDGSFGSVGAGIGAQVGGPIGSVVGGTAGTAIDMYMNYQANEERKRAERQRLEEARRQQNFSNRQADRDRALAASKYEDSMGLTYAQEGRNQESHDTNMKQKRVNMLRDAMTNSINKSETVRNIFAKRGVV